MRAGDPDVGPQGGGAARRPIVVVPTYQEAGNIEALLEGVLAQRPAVEVLVVDDSSPDGTAALVRSHPAFGDRVHLLSRPGRAGLGAAYRAGFAWALEAGYQRIGQMDADLSHPVDRLPALFSALDEAEVSVGSRYVPGGGVRAWPLRRRLLSSLGNRYVQLVLGTGVRDNTAGFRAFRREALERIEVLDSASSGYGFQIENTWRAVRRGLRIAEVPIVFTDRAVGRSKMSSSIAVEALLRVLAWRFGEVFTFLAVGGVGYVVDVAAFNAFRSMVPFSTLDPSVARTLAVVVAMVVTYVGNRVFTWPSESRSRRRREVALFLLANLIAFSFSIGSLLVSHDLLGLTSRLADNLSANVVGTLLGTAFRFWAYRRFVFAAGDAPPAHDPVPAPEAVRAV